MSLTKIWQRIIANPAIVVLVISLVLVVLNLYLAQSGRPYTSDDVSWQNILRTWSPVNGHIADMGEKDNFVVNVPLLMVTGHLFHAGRTLLFIDAAIFAVINFVLFYVAGLYFLKKCRIKISFETLLPFLWVASLGYNFSQLFLNSAWRDFEMGVSFVYFILIIKFHYGELEPFKSWTSRLLTVVAGIVAGLFIFSDPYFLYLTIGPIAILFLVLFLAKKVTKGQLALVLGSTIFSLVVSRVLKSVVARFGLFSPKAVPFNFVNLSQLVSEMVKSIDEMTTIFGVNISGVRIFSMVGIASLLNLAIIIAVGVWLVTIVVKYLKGKLSKVGQTSPLMFLSTFFGALYLLVFISTVANNEDNYRYFVISVYLVAVLATFVAGTLKKRSIYFIILVWAAILINLATAVYANTPMQQAIIASGNKANAANYALIEKIEQLGLSKGYANYWDGNVNTYLSDGEVDILPVTCINNETEELKLLVDTTQFKTPANKSFYVNDPSQTSPVMCSEHEVETQFGKPSETVSFQKKTILIYNYDIVSKMQ